METILDEQGTVIATPNDTSALSAYVAAEIDVQIATAKKYPRSIKHFRQNAMQLACLDEETAATMFYVLPRAGKKIEGPSVRLAEIVGSSWGNLRYGARVVEIGDRFLTAQGACHDLETNNAATVEVRRRITDKNGKRFGDDMIQVTANAACSIALRQAVFKIVPFALVKDIYHQAKLTSVGKASSMAEKRQKAIEWFIKAKATEQQVLDFLGKPSIDDIDMDDLVVLRGLVTAIKDGEISIEEALAVKDADSKRVQDSDLNAEIAGGTASKKKSSDKQPENFDPIAALAALAREQGCPDDGIDGIVAVAEGMPDPGDYIRSKPWQTKATKKQGSLV